MPGSHLLIYFVIIFDLLLLGMKTMRQLTFRAEYDVKCSSITDPVSQLTISAQSKHHFQQILEVCEFDHRDDDKGKPFIPVP